MKREEDTGGAAMRLAGQRLREEIGQDYVTAASADIDWCPCCGINIRLRDDGDKLAAKLIFGTPREARMFALGVMRGADEMARLAPDDTAKHRLFDEMMAVATQHRSQSTDDDKPFIGAME